MSRIEEETFSTVHITEQTLKEVLQAVEEAKEKRGSYEGAAHLLRGCGLKEERQIRNFFANIGAEISQGLQTGIATGIIKKV